MTAVTTTHAEAILSSARSSALSAVPRVGKRAAAASNAHLQASTYVPVALEATVVATGPSVAREATA